jgi:hypothetical protein
MASPVQILQERGSAPANRQAAEFADSRGARRFRLTTTVRAGWICDERRMTWAEAQGLDISESGLAIRLGERLRLSALVHLELPERGLRAIGRVASCVRAGDAYRVGLELVDAFHASRPGE